MDQEDFSFELCDGVFVPASALRKQKCEDKYGHVEGLADEELANPDELERVVYKEMWWPILRLPQQRWECPFRPNMDEDGRVEWGAFGTVDFDSYRPTFNKLRYKISKLREKLQDRIYTLKVMSARIPGHAKKRILRLVQLGRLDISQIVDNEMYFLAEAYVLALRLHDEIVQLQKQSRRYRQEDQDKWLSG